MSGERAIGELTIAVDIDDESLLDRVVAALAGADGVRLVGRDEAADVVVASRDARSPPSDAWWRTEDREAGRYGTDEPWSRTQDAATQSSASDTWSRPTTGAAVGLTPRELEVLALLAEGATNKTIARRLGISVHTAKFHVGSLLDKLDASGRTDAVTHAARLGVIVL